MLTYQIIRIFALSTIAFLVAFVWAPLLTDWLYKNHLSKTIRDSGSTPIFSRLHKSKAGTPTMGGILVWVTTAILVLVIAFLAKITHSPLWEGLNLLSREQTYLPLGVLVASAIVGFVDDLLNVKKIGPNGGGLSVKHRLFLYTLIAVVGAWWFYSKLEWDLIHIPFLGDFNIGFWYVPLFIFVLVATSFSVNETDGLDGLAGGVLLIAFAAFGVIAFIQGRFDLACLCGVIGGSLAAFLWFNIYPARFFMGDTGTMSLGITLAIIAMLTNTFLLLPIIGSILVIESLSVIIQVASKKIRKKKVFLSSPIHHHLEAIGWPEPKIVMRFWLISGITALIGLIIFLTESIVG
ncbi:MAG: Phospho-N-acetylmuramoyl-pentapeptide-transferase [Parcubacteria group bacterium ADurb.Bin159]|nr:MAG: Phospho-N-acetylmuramoyl-pentapeptide-transferase [Parcubacteria group bacterium ADurb.Bin159]